MRKHFTNKCVLLLLVLVCIFLNFQVTLSTIYDNCTMHDYVVVIGRKVYKGHQEAHA